MTVNAGAFSPLARSLCSFPPLSLSPFLMVLKSASIGIINAAPPMIMHRKEGKREADTHTPDGPEADLSFVGH